MLNLKVKKLNENSILPTRAKVNDAGIDLYCASINVRVNGQYELGTGIAVEIPDGYFGMIVPRSSITNTGFSLANSVGVIDSGYRGEILFRFNLIDANQPMYNVGDRIGQLLILPVPEVKILEVTELSDSERGEGGFGSTGHR